MLCALSRALVEEMLGEGSGLVGPARDELLHQMMRDQYGNYVVQKTLEVSPCFWFPADDPFKEMHLAFFKGIF